MFQKLALIVIEKFLGKFVHKIDKEKLQLSAWNGTATLTNVCLKEYVATANGLQFKIKEGSRLQRFFFKANWMKLASEKIIVELDGLTLFVQMQKGVEEFLQTTKDQQHLDLQLWENFYFTEKVEEYVTNKDSYFSTTVQKVLENVEVRVTNTRVELEAVTTFCLVIETVVVSRPEFASVTDFARNYRKSKNVSAKQVGLSVGNRQVFAPFSCSATVAWFDKLVFNEKKLPLVYASGSLSKLSVCVDKEVLRTLFDLQRLLFPPYETATGNKIELGQLGIGTDRNKAENLVLNLFLRNQEEGTSLKGFFQRKRLQNFFEDQNIYKELYKYRFNVRNKPADYENKLKEIEGNYGNTTLIHFKKLGYATLLGQVSEKDKKVVSLVGEKKNISPCALLANDFFLPEVFRDNEAKLFTVVPSDISDLSFFQAKNEKLFLGSFDMEEFALTLATNTAVHAISATVSYFSNVVSVSKSGLDFRSFVKNFVVDSALFNRTLVRTSLNKEIISIHYNRNKTTLCEKINASFSQLQIECYPEVFNFLTAFVAGFAQATSTTTQTSHVVNESKSLFGQIFSEKTHFDVDIALISPIVRLHQSLLADDTTVLLFKPGDLKIVSCDTANETYQTIKSLLSKQKNPHVVVNAFLVHLSDVEVSVGTEKLNSRISFQLLAEQTDSQKLKMFGLLDKVKLNLTKRTFLILLNHIRLNATFFSFSDEKASVALPIVEINSNKAAGSKDNFIENPDIPYSLRLLAKKIELLAEDMNASDFFHFSSNNFCLRANAFRMFATCENVRLNFFRNYMLENTFNFNGMSFEADPSLVFERRLLEQFCFVKKVHCTARLNIEGILLHVPNYTELSVTNGENNLFAEVDNVSVFFNKDFNKAFANVANGRLNFFVTKLDPILFFYHCLLERVDSFLTAFDNVFGSDETDFDTEHFRNISLEDLRNTSLFHTLRKKFYFNLTNFRFIFGKTSVHVLAELVFQKFLAKLTLGGFLYTKAKLVLKDFSLVNRSSFQSYDSLPNDRKTLLASVSDKSSLEFFFLDYISSNCHNVSLHLQGIKLVYSPFLWDLLEAATELLALPGVLKFTEVNENNPIFYAVKDVLFNGVLANISLFVPETPEAEITPELKMTGDFRTEVFFNKQENWTKHNSVGKNLAVSVENVLYKTKTGKKETFSLLAVDSFFARGDIDLEHMFFVIPIEISQVKVEFSEALLVFLNDLLKKLVSSFNESEYSWKSMRPFVSESTSVKSNLRLRSKGLFSKDLEENSKRSAFAGSMVFSILVKEVKYRYLALVGETVHPLLKGSFNAAQAFLVLKSLVPLDYSFSLKSGFESKIFDSIRTTWSPIKTKVVFKAESRSSPFGRLINRVKVLRNSFLHIDYGLLQHLFCRIPALGIQQIVGKLKSTIVHSSNLTELKKESKKLIVENRTGFKLLFPKLYNQTVAENGVSVVFFSSKVKINFTTELLLEGLSVEPLFVAPNLLVGREVVVSNKTASSSLFLSKKEIDQKNGLFLHSNTMLLNYTSFSLLKSENEKVGYRQVLWVPLKAILENKLQLVVQQTNTKQIFTQTVNLDCLQNLRFGNTLVSTVIASAKTSKTKVVLLYNSVLFRNCLFSSVVFSSADATSTVHSGSEECFSSDFFSLIQEVRIVDYSLTLKETNSLKIRSTDFNTEKLLFLHETTPHKNLLLQTLAVRTKSFSSVRNDLKKLNLFLQVTINASSAHFFATEIYLFSPNVLFNFSLSDVELYLSKEKQAWDELVPSDGHLVLGDCEDTYFVLKRNSSKLNFKKSNKKYLEELCSFSKKKKKTCSFVLKRSCEGAFVLLSKNSFCCKTVDIWSRVSKTLQTVEWILYPKIVLNNQSSVAIFVSAESWSPGIKLEVKSGVSIPLDNDVCSAAKKHSFRFILAAEHFPLSAQVIISLGEKTTVIFTDREKSSVLKLAVSADFLDGYTNFVVTEETLTHQTSFIVENLTDCTVVVSRNQQLCLCVSEFSVGKLDDPTLDKQQFLSVDICTQTQKDNEKKLHSFKVSMSNIGLQKLKTKTAVPGVYPKDVFVFKYMWRAKVVLFLSNSKVDFESITNKHLFDYRTLFELQESFTNCQQTEKLFSLQTKTPSKRFLVLLLKQPVAISSSMVGRASFLLTFLAKTTKVWDAETRDDEQTPDQQFNVFFSVVPRKSKFSALFVTNLDTTSLAPILEVKHLYNREKEFLNRKVVLEVSPQPKSKICKLVFPFQLFIECVLFVCETAEERDKKVLQILANEKARLNHKFQKHLSNFTEGNYVFFRKFANQHYALVDYFYTLKMRPQLSEDSKDASTFYRLRNLSVFAVIASTTVPTNQTFFVLKEANLESPNYSDRNMCYFPSALFGQKIVLRFYQNYSDNFRDSFAQKLLAEFALDTSQTKQSFDVDLVLALGSKVFCAVLHLELAFDSLLSGSKSNLLHVKQMPETTLSLEVQKLIVLYTQGTQTDPLSAVVRDLVSSFNLGESYFFSNTVLRSLRLYAYNCPASKDVKAFFGFQPGRALHQQEETETCQKSFLRTTIYKRNLHSENSLHFSVGGYFNTLHKFSVLSSVYTHDQVRALELVILELGTATFYLENSLLIAVLSVLSLFEPTAAKQPLLSELDRIIKSNRIETYNEPSVSSTSLFFLRLFYILKTEVRVGFLLDTEKIGKVLAEKKLMQQENTLRMLLTILDDFAIDEFPMVFSAFLVEDTLCTLDSLLNLLNLHYRSQTSQQGLKLLGSFAILGNPVHLVTSIKDGVTDVFREPAKNVAKGSGNMLEGVSVGTASLLGHTVSGFSGSLGGLASSFSNILSALTFDKEYLEHRRREKRKYYQQKPSIKSALSKAAKNTAEGITGIITKPVEGVRKGGARGLFEGLGKGISGVFIKPITSVFDVTSETLKKISYNSKTMVADVKKALDEKEGGPAYSDSTQDEFPIDFLEVEL